MVQEQNNILNDISDSFISENKAEEVGIPKQNMIFNQESCDEELNNEEERLSYELEPDEFDLAL